MAKVDKRIYKYFVTRVPRLDIDFDVSVGARMTLKRGGFFMSAIYAHLFFSDYLLVNHCGYCLLMKFEMPVAGPKQK
jgi:hypothetical protein